MISSPLRIVLVARLTAAHVDELNYALTICSLGRGKDYDNCAAGRRALRRTHGERKDAKWI